MVRLEDGGPIYTETDLTQFPVEPFNTFSNLAFLIVAIYWYSRLRKITDPRFQKFLKVGLPLLLVGFVGGTIYHATRSHMAWALLDVGPIYLIVFATSLFCWSLIKAKPVEVFLCFFVLTFIPIFLLFFVFPDFTQRQTLVYTSLFFPVVLPAFLDQIRTKWVLKREFFTPFAVVSIALVFRALDSWSFVHDYFPVGTHWLWHSFGALGCFYVINYLDKRTSLVVSR